MRDLSKVANFPDKDRPDSFACTGCTIPHRSIALWLPRSRPPSLRSRPRAQSIPPTIPGAVTCVQWAVHSAAAFVEYVRVDRLRLGNHVSQQFSHCTDAATLRFSGTTGRAVKGIRAVVSLQWRSCGTRLRGGIHAKYSCRQLGLFVLEAVLNV